MKATHRNYLLKMVLLLSLATFSLNINAQKKWDTKERLYRGGVGLSTLWDFEKKELGETKPFAKNVNIFYDPFYDKYTINFDMDGSFGIMILVESGKTNNGDIIYKDEYKIKSKQVEYFVTNKLETEGRLMVVTAYPFIMEDTKYKTIFVFEDFN